MKSVRYIVMVYFVTVFTMSFIVGKAANEIVTYVEKERIRMLKKCMDSGKNKYQCGHLNE